MQYEITQVGRRWFKVDILEPIEGSLSYYEFGQVEATYIDKYWERRREWTLVGKGARKYRSEITAALEEFVERN